MKWCALIFEESNRSKMRYAAYAFLPLFILGCATTSPLVEPEKRAPIGGVYTVEPQIEWSRFSQGPIETWTVDGPALQAIYFFKGVKPGKALIKADEEEKWPRFKSAMTAHEIMELVIDSLARMGYADLQPVNLRPAQFGPLPGFRFKFGFLYRSGLEGQGLAVGAVMEENLYLILYVGTRQYYYHQYADEVEKLIKSIRLVEG